MCVPYKRVRRKQVSIFVYRLAIQLSLSVFIISIFSLFTTHSVGLGQQSSKQFKSVAQNERIHLHCVLKWGRRKYRKMQKNDLNVLSDVHYDTI